jgi:hypothetical protein
MSVRSHSHAVSTLLLCIPAQRTRSNGVFAQHLRPSEGWIASAPGEVHRGVGKTARRDPWWKPPLSYLVPWTGTSRSSFASDHLNWLAGTSVVLDVSTRRLSNRAPSCRSSRRRLPTCSRLRRPLESGIMPHSPYLASRDRRTTATSRARSLRKTSSRRPASPTRLYGLRSLRDAPLLGPDLTGLAAGLMSAPLGQCPQRGITCRGEGNHDVHPCSTGGTGRFRPIPTPPT